MADHVVQLFGADLSLDPREHGNLDVHAGMIYPSCNITAEPTSTRQRCCSPDSLGKKNHTGGLVDYLGALPVMESSARISTLHSTDLSQGSYDSVSVSDIVSTQLTLFSNYGAGNACHNATDQNKIARPFAEKVNAFRANSTASFNLALGNRSLHCQDLLKQRQLPEVEDDLITTPHSSMNHSTAAHAKFDSLLVPCEAIVPRALPFARKASLTRFLEMRKKRLIAPYVAKGGVQFDTTPQGASHLNESNPRMCYDDAFRGDASAKKLHGCASWFVYGANVEFENEDQFNTLIGNTKPTLECESAN